MIIWWLKFLMVKHQQRWVLQGLIVSTWLNKIMVFMQVVTYKTYCVTFHLSLKYFFLKLHVTSDSVDEGNGDWSSVQKGQNFRIGHITLKFVHRLFSVFSCEVKKLQEWSDPGSCVNMYVPVLNIMYFLEFLIIQLWLQQYASACFCNEKLYP
jgi:hypothetical protein